VEWHSATLGKKLPIGKFGNSPSPKAEFWNFHPAAETFVERYLTSWKNNLKLICDAFFVSG
jgi:hypothetical protein